MKKSLKERWLLIKAAFDTTTPPVDPANPPAPVATAKVYKLKNGTEVSISQAGEMPAVGDMVTINGAAAPAGVHEIEDGSSVTVDATGMITLYTPKPAEPPAADPANPPAPVTLSAFSVHVLEDVQKMFAMFATGTIEEQVANLNIMMKAVMEYCYGYKIREGQENTAIQVYKDTVATPVAAAPVVTVEEVQAMSAKLEAQRGLIGQLVEFTEQLADEPTSDPKTLSGKGKEKFEAMNDKEARIERKAAAMRQMKEDAKKV